MSKDWTKLRELHFDIYIYIYISGLVQRLGAALVRELFPQMIQQQTIMETNPVWLEWKHIIQFAPFLKFSFTLTNIMQIVSQYSVLQIQYSVLQHLISQTGFPVI